MTASNSWGQREGRSGAIKPQTKIASLQNTLRSHSPEISCPQPHAPTARSLRVVNDEESNKFTDTLFVSNTVTHPHSVTTFS